VCVAPSNSPFLELSTTWQKAQEGLDGWVSESGATSTAPTGIRPELELECACSRISISYNNVPTCRALQTDRQTVVAMVWATGLSVCLPSYSCLEVGLLYDEVVKYVIHSPLYEFCIFIQPYHKLPHLVTEGIAN